MTVIRALWSTASANANDGKDSGPQGISSICEQAITQKATKIVTVAQGRFDSLLGLTDHRHRHRLRAFHRSIDLWPPHYVGLPIHTFNCLPF